MRRLCSKVSLGDGYLSFVARGSPIEAMTLMASVADLKAALF